MARIRTIKPEFWTSEQVMECSTTARLLFIGMLNFCDDGGNHPASAKRLKAQVFPSDDITTADIEKMVCELVSTGLISEYSAEDRCYWHVTGWHHQKIEKPTYKHPPYKIPQQGAEQSASSRRVVGEPSTPEGKGNGREVNQESPPTTTSPPPPVEIQKPSSSVIEKNEERCKVVAKRLTDMEAKRGITFNFRANETRLVAWVASGVTDPQLREAYELALAERERAGELASAINYGFLKKFIDKVLADEGRGPPVPIPIRSWHESASGIEAKGAELGLSRRFDEPFPTFKARVFEAAGLEVEAA